MTTTTSTPTYWPVATQQVTATDADGIPTWWPAVKQSVLHKRRFTALMLELAEARVEDGTLHLTFRGDGAAEHFRKSESGCMPVLETALREHGLDIPVAVHAA